jgi:hypothetical protein
MNKHLIAAAAILTLAVPGAVLAGDIYKWVDEDGNVHYGDKPIGTQSERMAIESRPTDPSRVSAATESLMASRDAAAERRADMDATAAEQAELRAEAEQRAERCASARAQLQRMLTARRVYQEDENGERVYLDDAERNAARERVENQIDDYCGS